MTTPKEIEMATTRTVNGTTAKSSSAASRDESSRTAAVGDAVVEAAGTVRGAAGEAVARLPEAVATTRSAIEDANRQMRSGSDEMLSVGSVLSFGFAMGLLIGGASRLLVAVALIPAAAMGLTLMDRVSRRGRPASRTVQGG
jgi:hypothetical protein